MLNSLAYNSNTPIIAAVVAGVVVLIILALLFFFVCRRKKRQKENNIAPNDKYVAPFPPGNLAIPNGTVSSGSQANMGMGGPPYTTPYAAPNMGATYSTPSMGDPYSNPNMGAAYSNPSIDAAYSNPNIGAVYSNPSMGAAYSNPNMGDPYSTPSTGGPYSSNSIPGSQVPLRSPNADDEARLAYRDAGSSVTSRSARSEAPPLGNPWSVAGSAGGRGAMHTVNDDAYSGIDGTGSDSMSQPRMSMAGSSVYSSGAAGLGAGGHSIQPLPTRRKGDPLPLPPTANTPLPPGASRMYVPGREQDFGPLPPDYSQATEPYHSP